MTFSTYYDSNDTGLGGIGQAAGQAIAFLDKVLVNGYNSKTLTTLTSVSVLCTATLTSHGFRDLQFVTISGATPSAYNGTWQIIAGTTTANTFQFNVSSPPGSSATGTIGCIVAPLGWTKPFSGTNLAAYRQATGNGFYIDIDDTGTQTCPVLGFETMSAITVGNNQFPTPTMIATNSAPLLCKSNAAAARRIIFWGNGSIFYLFSDFTGNSSSGTLFYFGDAISNKTGDAYCTVICGETSAGAFTTVSSLVPAASGTTFPTVIHGSYVARDYTQMPGSVPISLVVDVRFSTAMTTAGASFPFGGASGTFPYPAPIDGNLWMSPVVILSGNSIVRGTLPGITTPMHNRPLTATYTIFTGAGSTAGKTFMIIYLATTGSIIAEISNTF